MGLIRRTTQAFLICWKKIVKKIESGSRAAKGYSARRSSHQYGRLGPLLQVNRTCEVIKGKFAGFSVKGELNNGLSRI
jgi:hypothetical protein